MFDFLYSFVAFLGVGFITFIYGTVFRLDMRLLYVLLFLVVSLAIGVSMGIFGHFYAMQKTIDLESNYSLTDLQLNLNKINFEKTVEENNIITYSNKSKYYEWFYGKIIIQVHNDKIAITAAKCILDKYFWNKNSWGTHICT